MEQFFRSWKWGPLRRSFIQLFEEVALSLFWGQKSLHIFHHMIRHSVVCNIHALWATHYVGEIMGFHACFWKSPFLLLSVHVLSFFGVIFGFFGIFGMTFLVSNMSCWHEKFDGFLTSRHVTIFDTPPKITLSPSHELVHQRGCIVRIAIQHVAEEEEWWRCQVYQVRLVYRWIGLNPRWIRAG